MENKIIKIKDIVIQGDTILQSPAINRPLKKPIGVNSISSFDGIFTEEKIIIEYGLGRIVLGKIGDVSEAYKTLEEKIKTSKSFDFEKISTLVFEVVDEYFGRFENVKSRMLFYPDEDSIYSGEDYGKISELKGKSSAMCVERAALAQNLLKIIGINSIFKSSKVIINGKHDAHAYNLVEYDGKYYIFDTTIPTLRDGIISPIITEIPQDVFNAMSMPMIDGYSVEISHFNPLQEIDYTIIYDSGREKSISIDGTNGKKL